MSANVRTDALSCATPRATAATDPARGATAPRVTRHAIPRVFAENRGQYADGIAYRSILTPDHAALTEDGLVLAQIERDADGIATRGHTVRLSFTSHSAKAAPARLVPGTPAPTRVSVFRGKDPEQWVSAAPSWQSVVYEEAATGIDVEIHGRRGVLEYDVLAQPGARVEDLVVVVEGAERLEPREDGGISIVTPLGRIEQGAPIVWEEDAEGRRTPLLCQVTLHGPDRMGFTVPGWEGRGRLTIDPTLVYSTFVEGSAIDAGYSIAVDDAGFAYVGGLTSSLDFPATPGAFAMERMPMGDDAVLFKLAPSGDALEYATYLGGAGSSENAKALVIDAEGHVYVCGTTRAVDFPTTAGAYATETNGGSFDAFVTKLDPMGSTLVYSTLFGGSGIDNAQDLALDSQGRIVLGGQTKSFDLPTSRNAVQGTKPNPSAVDFSGYIARLSMDGSQLDYCSFFCDWLSGIGVDADDNVYVGGVAAESIFGWSVPVTAGAFQTLPSGIGDAFIGKVTAAGDLVWCTLLGGTNVEYVNGFAVDVEGHVTIQGYTHSGSSFPTTPGAFDPTFNGASDVYVTKFTSDGSALVYSTRLGGIDDEQGYDIALGPDGSCYVLSHTRSWNFPVTPDAQQPALSIPGKHDPHLGRLSPDGSTLLYGSFLGGPSDKSEHTHAIAVDAQGRAYITGYTLDPLFPTTPGVFDTELSGSNGLFVMVFDLSPWTDLGQGSPGTGGVVPVLTGEGTLQPGSAGEITLSAPAPITTGFLIVGIDELLAPLQGGTLVPTPTLMLPLLPGGNGFTIPWSDWPADVPAGGSLVFQAWLADSGSPWGWASSNGLRMISPVTAP